MEMFVMTLFTANCAQHFEVEGVAQQIFFFCPRTETIFHAVTHVNATDRRRFRAVFDQLLFSGDL